MTKAKKSRCTLKSRTKTTVADSVTKEKLDPLATVTATTGRGYKGKQDI